MDRLEQVAAHRPTYAAALAEVLAALADQDLVDAGTLALCRDRIGQLLGLDTAGPHRAVTHRQQVAIDYAEQVLMDAAEVTDAQAAEVIEAFGEGGFLVLTYACGLFETTQRAELVLS